MKQKQQAPPSSKLDQRIRTVSATRLTAVRGGGGLGITVATDGKSSDFMQNQHNEALVRF